MIPLFIQISNFSLHVNVHKINISFQPYLQKGLSSECHQRDFPTRWGGTRSRIAIAAFRRATNTPVLLDELSYGGRYF